MGYRSDVRILIPEKDFNELCNRMRKKLLQEKINSNLLDHLCIRQVRSGTEFGENGKQVKYVYFGWDSIKWYNTFTDVELIEDFLLELDDYHFIRLAKN